MVMPGFSAEASVYRTRQHYNASSIGSEGLSSSESIVPAYYPGPAAQAACNKCLVSAVEDYFNCIATQGFPFSLIHCTLKSWWDGGSCIVDDCCPKRCGPPDFFNLAGSGCCDANETCVAKNDPNSRHGCCPSGQSVCGGKCCPTGGPCCGDECGCTGGTVCTEGACTFPSFGSGGPPPPPPLTQHGTFCFFGKPCYDQCCPPDKKCCCPPGRPCGCYHDYLCIQ
jgi:hypothetical protein